MKLYNIPSDISQTIITSLKDAVLRALDFFDSLHDDHEVFLSIYISEDAQKRSRINHSWGFFRLERTNPVISATDTKKRYIELYLYLD